MKNLKSLILLFSALVIFSCSSDDDGDDSTIPDVVGDGLITARVDDSSFTSTSASTSATVSGINLMIDGSNSNGDRITFTIDNFEEGSFDLSGSTLEGTGIYLPSGDSTFFSSANPGGEGTLTITELDDTFVSGTFSFVAARRSDGEIFSITNGSFSDIAIN